MRKNEIPREAEKRRQGLTTHSGPAEPLPDCKINLVIRIDDERSYQHHHNRQKDL